jgi:hypothetical protein
MAETRLAGIYNIKGVKNKNCINVKHLETQKMSAKDKIRDTSITTYPIDKQQGIFGEIFACNILDKNLMSSKKQPLIYVSTFLSKPLKTAMLYDIKLFFTIDDEIKSENEFLSRPLKGHFSLELLRDGQSVNLDMKITKFPGETKMLKQLMDFTKTDDMVEILSDMALDEEDKIADKYKSNFKYDKIPEPTIKLEDYDLDDYY